MRWFKKWKQDVQKDLRAEVLLNQLHFLAKEFIEGNSRAVDYDYWVRYLDELKDLCAKKDVGLIGAYEAYELLFEQYKAKILKED